MKEDNCHCCCEYGETEQIVEDVNTSTEDVDTSTEDVEVAFASLTHEDVKELLHDKKPEQVPELIPKDVHRLLVCSAHPNGSCPYPHLDTTFFNFQLADKKDESK